MIELLRRETADFIPPDMWPPNSLDLNSADYCIWGLPHERMYHTPMKDVHTRAAAATGLNLNRQWSMKQSTRLKDCILAKGDHFKHVFNQTL